MKERRIGGGRLLNKKPAAWGSPLQGASAISDPCQLKIAHDSPYFLALMKDGGLEHGAEA